MATSAMLALLLANPELFHQCEVAPEQILLAHGTVVPMTNGGHFRLASKNA